MCDAWSSGMGFQCGHTYATHLQSEPFWWCSCVVSHSGHHDEYGFRDSVRGEQWVVCAQAFVFCWRWTNCDAYSANDPEDRAAVYHILNRLQSIRYRQWSQLDGGIDRCLWSRFGRCHCTDVLLLSIT